MLRRVSVVCLGDCADDDGLAKLISDFWGYPATDSDVRTKNSAQQYNLNARELDPSSGAAARHRNSGGQIPITITGVLFYIFEMFPAGVLQRCPEQHMCYRALFCNYMCYRARYAMPVHVSALQRHASDGGTGC